MEESKFIAMYYQRKTLGSFGMALMDLFGKADLENKARLGIAFPEYAEAHELWLKGDYPKDGEES